MAPRCSICPFFHPSAVWPRSKDKSIPTAGWAVVQCVVSGTLWAGNTPLGMRGAKAEWSFGNLVSNQLTLGPFTLEVRAAVTLTVPLGGPVGQALGFDAAVCQCLRNGSASAQRETRMASQNVDVLSKRSLGREPQATSKPAGTTRVVLICQTGSHFTDTSSTNPQTGWLSSHLFQHGFMGGIPTVL